MGKKPTRKTVNVEEIKQHANSILKSRDLYFTKDFKSGICAMLEKTLHLSGNYNGFMFIDNEDSEIDTLGYFSRKYF